MELEDGLTIIAYNMHVGRSVIVRVNHHTPPAEPANCYHLIINQSAWVIFSSIRNQIDASSKRLFFEQTCGLKSPVIRPHLAGEAFSSAIGGGMCGLNPKLELRNEKWRARRPAPP